MVVVQPQHSQAFKLSNEGRHFLQVVVVQQELAHGAVRPNKRGSVGAAITQAVVGQLQGLQARLQVAEGEGGDVADVVVSQGQLTEAARQIRGDGGELVGRQVQSFQRPDGKHEGCVCIIGRQEVQSCEWDAGRVMTGSSAGEDVYGPHRYNIQHNGGGGEHRATKMFGVQEKKQKNLNPKAVRRGMGQGFFFF